MLRPRKSSPWGRVPAEEFPDTTDSEALAIIEFLNLPGEYAPALAESLRVAEDFA